MRVCSYFGNLYFDAFQLHVEEMKDRGFDTLLLCITETDLLYNLQIFHGFRIYAKREGMEVWATFWGLTAGEAICKDGNVEKWLKAVKSIGFQNIMIDEPKDKADIYKFTDNEFLNYHLCLTDDTFWNMTDEEIRILPVKSVGVSCYHWVTNWGKIATRTAAISKRLLKIRPHDNFVFVQGFDIPEGYELIPTVVKEVAEISGVNDFGFWSFRCTAATATKRPVNYKSIWENIKF